MPSLTDLKYHFTPPLHALVCTLILITLFTRLGFWQLTRADEKKQILASQSAHARLAPTLWKRGMARPKQYQLLTVTGSFLPDILLLDNQHDDHQFGYHVIGSFRLSENTRLPTSCGSSKHCQLILINLGWIAGDSTRQTLPHPDLPKGVVTLIGHAYYPVTTPWLFGSLIEKQQGNMTVIEQLSLPLISTFLHKSLDPFMIRLQATGDLGYKRDWTIVAMPPKRHIAYAIQWFAMAALVGIVWIIVTIKRISKQKEPR